MMEENKPIGSGIEDPHTLFEMHEKIEHKEYVLPAIQRKFVWEEKDITRLFDSLMLGYPIGSFLISPSNANTCLTLKYYACLKQRNYDEAFDNNMELDPVSYPDSFLLLDGQQRLTSIHIGLTGCIIRRGQTDERKLYYNYKKTPDLNKDKFHNKSYEFEFLKSKDKKVKEWFLVNDILKYKDNLKDLLTQYAKNQIEEENLTRLHYVVFENKNLHVYKMSNDSSVYDILSVFDRLNSSGTKLSNPNLIFSVLVSKWNNARQEIDSLLNTINKKGFQFTEEYVIKFALVAIGLPSTLKLKDFSVNNHVNTISENWEVIKCSIIETITLLSEKYYMNQDHIISENAIIPINYLLYLRLKEKKKNSNKDISEYKYKRVG